MTESIDIELVSSAFNTQYCFRVRIKNTIADIGSFLSLIQEKVVEFLCLVLRQSSLQFKISFVIQCTYYHPIIEETLEKTHSAPIFSAYSEFDIEECYKKACQVIQNEETEFVTKKSGWVLIACDCLLLTLFVFSPTRV